MMARPALAGIDQTNLEWQTFDGSLPNGAVSIYNGDAERTDYVSKHGSVPGFYNPAMGPHCRYPWGYKEHLGRPFEILVNKDDFEFLEWKKSSYGSVPPNSVNTISNNNTYVGKNKYGLGKVSVTNEAFYVPWKGKELCSQTDYQILTFNSDISSEHMSDVKYKTDEAKKDKLPPETMEMSTLINEGCEIASQTVSFSKKSQVEQTWHTSFSITVGIETTITAGIPNIASASFKSGVATTRQFTNGATHTESKDHTVSVECKVPPKHSCTVSMVGHKHEVDIPYTARLSRTYKNGETRQTSISGTYKHVEVMEVRSVVGPCEPLPDARP